MSDPALFKLLGNSNVWGHKSVAHFILQNQASREIVYFLPKLSLLDSYCPAPGVSLANQSCTCSFEITYPYVFILNEYIGLVLLLLGVCNLPIQLCTSYSPGPVSFEYTGILIPLFEVASLFFKLSVSLR